MRRVTKFHQRHPHFAIWVFVVGSYLLASQSLAVGRAGDKKAAALARTSDKHALCVLSAQRWTVQHEVIRTMTNHITPTAGQEGDLLAAARRETRNRQLDAQRIYLDRLLGAKPQC